MDFPCDQSDCIIHPEHKKPKPKVSELPPDEISGLKFESIPIDNNYSLEFNGVRLYKDLNRESELILRFEAYDLTIPFECLFCSYRNNVDMKSKVVNCKAKNMLTS